MNANTALTVRRLGLTIEVVCLLGLLSVYRSQDIEPKRFLGITLGQALTTGLALGFTLWVLGTITYYYWKYKRKKGDAVDPE